MGQAITSHLQDFKIDVLKEAHLIKEMMEMTHQEFLSSVKELNQLVQRHYIASTSQEKSLHFFVKRHSDKTFLWKQTVRIACLRVDVTDGYRDVYIDEDIMAGERVLSLRQFLLAHKLLTYHDTCTIPPSPSLILDKIISDSKPEIEECIICMERKPEVTLPCAHAYCLVCIEQWKADRETCPVCRADLSSGGEEMWVTPDIPDAAEVNAQVDRDITAVLPPTLD